MKIVFIICCICLIGSLCSCALFHQTKGTDPVSSEINLAWLVDALAGVLNPNDPTINEDALDALGDKMGIKLTEIVKLALQTYVDLKNHDATPQDVLLKMPDNEADRTFIERETGRKLAAIVALSLDSYRALTTPKTGRALDPDVMKVIDAYHVKETQEAASADRRQTLPR